MARAFLDTNVLFASANARDQLHDGGREILTRIDHGDLPTATVTNYVVAETLNLVREKLGPETATAMLDRLVEGSNFDLTHATKVDFTTAQALFRQFDGLSFVDATIVATMRRMDTEFLYSFDDDFDAIDAISRLQTPTNPFS